MVQFVEDGFDGFPHSRGAGVGAGIFGVDRIEGRGLVLFERVVLFFAGAADADEVHVIALGGVGRFHCRRDGCGELVGIGGGEVLPAGGIGDAAQFALGVGRGVETDGMDSEVDPEIVFDLLATAQGFRNCSARR